MSGLLQLLLEGDLLAPMPLDLAPVLLFPLSGELLLIRQLPSLAIQQVLQITDLDLQWLVLTYLLVERPAQRVAVLGHVRALHLGMAPQLLVERLQLPDLGPVDLLALLLTL